MQSFVLELWRGCSPIDGFADDQDFSENKTDCLVACRLNLYYMMAAQVRRNCARKLLVTRTGQATAIQCTGTPS